MDTMMEWFCERRECARAVAPRIEIPVGDDVFDVAPWDDPLDALKAFSKHLSKANRSLSDDRVARLAREVCQARSGWCATPPRALTIEIKDVGEATCRPWEEPAEILDDFYMSQRKEGKRAPTPAQLKSSLELMCSSGRGCLRKKIKTTAKALFMHPGKTAGRAIGDALRNAPDVFVLGHDDRCDGAEKPCHVVLREPPRRGHRAFDDACS